MCVDGWIPVDPLTLETSVPRRVRGRRRDERRHARRPACSPKGRPRSSPTRSSPAIADRPASATYDGRGICYLEFGDDEVARVEVTFRSGETPAGQFDGPSEANTADKSDFGTTRIRRWFGREWTTH